MPSDIEIKPGADIIDGFEITMDGGKYTIRCKVRKYFEALRYGKPWRDLVGDSLIFLLCCKLIEKPSGNTVDDNLKEMFEYHMSEVQEEYPELTHGALTMTAAERTIEGITERVERIADNRKWGHIEEVNKSHFDKLYAGGADPFTGG